MEKTDRLTVKFHGKVVGKLSLTPDNKLCAFNYLTDNKDDHCKNFSFLVTKNVTGKWRWRLAPAYDLTLCKEGYNGEHASSVNGKGNPELTDFIEVGTKIRINERRCCEIFEQVKAATDKLYATING